MSLGPVRLLGLQLSAYGGALFGCSDQIIVGNPVRLKLSPSVLMLVEGGDQVFCSQKFSCQFTGILSFFCLLLDCYLHNCSMQGSSQPQGAPPWACCTSPPAFVLSVITSEYRATEAMESFLHSFESLISKQTPQPQVHDRSRGKTTIQLPCMFDGTLSSGDICLLPNLQHVRLALQPVNRSVLRHVEQLKSMVGFGPWAQTCYYATRTVS